MLEKRAAGAWRGVAALLGAGALALSAQAQPAKGDTLDLVVPYGPGGPTDVIARLMAKKLQESLNRVVIVTNTPGAGSAIGARAVARAAPDGKTILVGNVSTFTILPAVQKAPGYDPLTSFVPIAKLSDSGAVLVTQADFPAKTLKEFVAYAKANPGKVFFGSAGVGNSAHLVGELMKAKAGIEMGHVPYKGGADTITAVRGGQVTCSFVDVASALGMIREGKIRALATTTAQRLPLLPDVPTMAESGYPDIVFSNWSGAAAPAGTDPAIVAELESAFNKATASADYQEFLKKTGGEAAPSSSKAFGALIRDEYKKWSEVARHSRISLE